MKRLRVMSPAEIMHRVGERCTMRLMHVRHQLSRFRDGSGACDPARFSFCRAKEPQLPGLPWELTAEAERALAGESSAPGGRWVWRPDDAVWHEASDTGRRWPRRFFSEISHRAGNPYGDVRMAWEPSRLQQLVTLAHLARRRTAHERARAVAMLEAQLLSWVRSNPPLTGIHYISAMECALRIIAVCHAVDLARDILQSPRRTWPAVVELVAGHAGMIARRLSRHSSLGNHTIAEAVGLVYAGALFPEMENADRWLATGTAVLGEESGRQILPDGGGLEQAFWYLLFIADLYGLAATLLEHRRLPLPGSVRDAHRRAASFLGDFAAAPSELPPIGDADHGYALSPYLRLSFGRERPWKRGLTTYERAGYSVVRAVEPERVELIFDHGPLGMEPGFGHGHADALSVSMRLDRDAVLLDPGTCTYADPPWRAYFRGTAAHNTVTVDGQDQAIQETAFLWTQPFHAELVRREVSPDGAVRLLARHDGYERRLGVTHWRAILYQPPGFWLIWDQVAGQGVHEADLHWHLGVEPLSDARSYYLRIADRTLGLSVEGGTGTLHRGETDPPSGWRSPRYGVKEPITTLRVRARGSLPLEFRTQLWLSDEPRTADEAAAEVSRLRRWIDDASAR
jgi:hypothetical protein